MNRISQIFMLVLSFVLASTLTLNALNAQEGNSTNGTEENNAAGMAESKGGSQSVNNKPVTMSDQRFKIGSEWNLESDDGEIQTYTRYLEGMSLRAFKVVTSVDAPLPQTLMFLNDSTQFHRWINMMKEAHILQQTDPDGVSYNHMITKVPWPIRNRDVVVRATVEYNKELGEVLIHSKAAPDFIPHDEDLVRIRESSASWKITKLSNGKLRLELTSHAEPGGSIPKWLSNMVVLQLPKYMFSRLPEILESEEVKNLEFDSIQIFGKEVDLS
jgi:hypothetical protein